MLLIKGKIYNYTFHHRNDFSKEPERVMLIGTEERGLNELIVKTINCKTLEVHSHSAGWLKEINNPNEKIYHPDHKVQINTLINFLKEQQKILNEINLIINVVKTGEKDERNYFEWIDELVSLDESSYTTSYERIDALLECSENIAKLIRRIKTIILNSQFESNK